MENKHFQEIVENIRRMPNVANTQEEYALMIKIRLGSLILLYMEHLRRTLLFMETIKFNFEGKDFFTIKLSNVIGAYWGDPYELLSDYEDELLHKINPGMGHYAVHVYFLWHFHKEKIDKMGFNFIQDPVEPIWIYILRGGYLRTEQFMILITNFGIRHTLSANNRKMLLNKAEPFIDCYNEAALDLADKELLTDREAFLKKYVYEYV